MSSVSVLWAPATQPLQLRNPKQSGELLDPLSGQVTARGHSGTELEGAIRLCGLAHRRSTSFPLLGGAEPDGSARLAAVPQLLHKPEQFCGTARFTVPLKRTALTEARGALFCIPKPPVF